MDKKINVISTTCKDCLFGKYDGKTQVGCELGRIEKIKEHPVYDLVEAYDEQKEFYVLNHHLCLHQRVSGWIHDNKSMDEMVREVKEEIKMNWGAILSLKNETTQDMSRVQQRLEEITNQTNPPKWIGVINQDVDLDVFWIIDYLNKKDIKWSIESGQEHTRHYIDVLFNKFKKDRFVFYAFFESHMDIPSDLYDRMHRNVIDNLMQYSVIKDNDSLHCMLVNKVAHMKYEGNQNVALETKIKEKSKIDLLLNHEDLR